MDYATIKRKKLKHNRPFLSLRTDPSKKEIRNVNHIVLENKEKKPEYITHTMTDKEGLDQAYQSDKNFYPWKHNVHSWNQKLQRYLR